MKEKKGIRERDKVLRKAKVEERIDQRSAQRCMCVLCTCVVHDNDDDDDVDGDDGDGHKENRRV